MGIETLNLPKGCPDSGLSQPCPRACRPFLRRLECRFSTFVKTLLLWDIDGTLLTSGGAGMAALQVALLRVFGVAGSLDDIDFADRTYCWIMRQILRKFGLLATGENFDRYREGYLAELPAQLSGRGVHVLPGVQSLLQAAAARGDIAQGLLTGNFRRGAQAKLSVCGLWEFFPFGAFADDAELRDELGPHALRRARSHHGAEFPPERVWVIGDTPHDIACGRRIGARTLAVATGGHSLAELRAHAPTLACATLDDTAALLRAFDAD